MILMVLTEFSNESQKFSLSWKVEEGLTSVKSVLHFLPLVAVVCSSSGASNMSCAWFLTITVWPISNLVLFPSLQFRIILPVMYDFQVSCMVLPQLVNFASIILPLLSPR